MKKIFTLLLLILITITGCTTDKPVSNEATDLTIYTTIYPIQYAVERIGGDSVSVETVFPPGVDAHTYEPTSKDMTEIARSDGFFYLGAGMEGFAESMAEALESQDVSLIELGKHEELFIEAVDHHEEEHHDEHHHGDHDPHIWIDPLRMIDISTFITEELVKLHPEKEEIYQENLAKLEQDLLDLDQKFMESLSNKTNKKLLVSHAAFGYWEARYDIEQIAINGLSSSSEPSQKELTKIIEKAKQHELNYIVFEQNSTNQVSEIVQEQIDAERLVIHNLSVLTEQDINNHEDYFTLMERNLEMLDQATSE